MDLLREARIRCSRLHADPRHHNAMPCVCSQAFRSKLLRLGSYHFVVLNRKQRHR